MEISPCSASEPGSWEAPKTHRLPDKEAWDALVGMWKDDPNFDDFLREINKERNCQKDDNQA
jgi:hypothetical protein